MPDKGKTDEKTYKGICHTTCYWLETRWEVGEEYEGSYKPNKHFSVDGKIDKPLPPPNSGDDPRSNIELVKALKAPPNNFTAPKSWSRKQIWTKLRDLERAAKKDELTNPSDGVKRPGRPKAK